MIFLSVFITLLIEKLNSGNLTRLGRSARISSKLTHLAEILSLIQPVIADAAQKQRSQVAVKMWLSDLQHLAYEADDIIDGLASKANEVIPTSCTPNNILWYGRKMSSRLDKITHRLQSHFRDIDMLGLNLVIADIPYVRVVPTSLLDDFEIVGRDEEKHILMRRLLDNEVVASGQSFSVVSIVGMGGVGKTTIARLLYNDNKVKDYFEVHAWVCASEFDVFDISNAIYQSLGGVKKAFVNLNMLQMALVEQLSNKRFLLVLDDVWSEDYRQWELLQRPFLVGAPGSRIIVTTRKAHVAVMMGSHGAFHLSVLSDEDALSLIARCALNEQSFDSAPELSLIARRITQKCMGLPLALKALGRLLRTKRDYEEWMALLDSVVWNSSYGIIPPLRLSYEDLPPHLKQMFAYCSLFPKNYVFHKDELVLLWMAEGFLYQANDIKSMEGFGLECFKELEMRSFFQQLTNDKNEYTMHDLVNDLAISVGGELFRALDDASGVGFRNDDLGRVCHLSFIRQRFEVYSKFKRLQEARRLRTLLAVSFPLDDQQKCFLSNKVLTETILQLQFLRVLNLSNYSISEIPPSIGSLKHIRYLNFSRTDITCLPEQVGDLYNLQSLLLGGCEKLHSLPNSLGKLSNLRHLDISDTPRLSNMPLGIGELQNLQTLSKVLIERVDGFKLNDLKNLSDLQGRFSIEGLHNVENATQAKDANLQQKKRLHDVEMKWNDDFDDSIKRYTEYGVLKDLIPYHELRNLKILFYGGEKFPSWVGDPSFTHLTELTLRGCRSCSELPTLGHLMSLCKLFVEAMDEVENVGSELTGPSDSFNGTIFPSLEVLEFKDMQAWKTWIIGSGTTTWFPRLGEISIVNCPNLDVVSVGCIQSLKILRIQRCPKAVLESMVGVSSSISKLMMENIVGLTGLHVEVLKHLRAVEYLSIKQCDKLEYLWETESEACENLVRLSKLEVEHCKSLVSLEEKQSNLISSMTSVKHMDLRNCESLMRCKCPNSIERLVIYDCPSMTSLTFPTVQEGLRSSLNILDIRRCDKLGESWLVSDFLKPLEYLELGRLPNLRSMPEGCFVNLTRLILRGCDHLESITEKNLHFVHLRSLEIISCMGLKSFPHEHLQSLVSLEELWISNCPSLDSFPCGVWPPNLSTLTIGGLKKPMSKWGEQNFPHSLVTLYLHGENSGVVSFASISNTTSSSSSFLLPRSLSFLELNGFTHLKSVSEGLQHLTHLKGLVIDSCPKLGDLPVGGLLSGLSSLKVYNCLKLQEKCHSKRGKYRSIISGIPELYV